MKKPVKKIITLSALLFTGMHIFNEYTDASLAPMQPVKNDKIYQWKTMNIHYTEKGSSDHKPLLLLHNLCPSSSKEEWCQVDHSLSLQYHIFELDLPGCGKSSKPNITYINYMYVELLHDFIQEIIGSKTNICATAFSSSFTLMTARIYPEILEKIIIINPTSFEKLYAPVSKEGKIKEKILELPVIGTFLYNCIMSKSAITDQYQYKYYYNENSISEQAIDNSYYHAHYNHSAGKYLFGSMLANYTNINIIHALPKINHAIVFIGNNNYKHIFEEYKKYNPSIQTEYVSHCRLLPQLEIPETIIEKIKNIIYTDEQ